MNQQTLVYLFKGENDGVYFEMTESQASRYIHDKSDWERQDLKLVATIPVPDFAKRRNEATKDLNYKPFDDDSYIMEVQERSKVVLQELYAEIEGEYVGVPKKKPVKKDYISIKGTTTGSSVDQIVDTNAKYS